MDFSWNALIARAMSSEASTSPPGESTFSSTARTSWSSAARWSCSLMRVTMFGTPASMDWPEITPSTVMTRILWEASLSLRTVDLFQAGAAGAFRPHAGRGHAAESPFEVAHQTGHQQEQQNQTQDGPTPTPAGRAVGGRGTDHRRRPVGRPGCERRRGGRGGRHRGGIGRPGFGRQITVHRPNLSRNPNSGKRIANWRPGERRQSPNKLSKYV